MVGLQPKVGGKFVKIFLDTGSSASIFNSSVLNGLAVYNKSSPRSFTGVSGSILNLNYGMWY